MNIGRFVSFSKLEIYYGGTNVYKSLLKALFKVKLQKFPKTALVESEARPQNLLFRKV